MRNPILFQANTRLWLAELSQRLGRPATLDDLPTAELERLAGLGFDWLYLLCVWQTGEPEAQIARLQPGLQIEARRLLGSADEDALCSSCFAIQGYNVNPDWGGEAALARLRQRARQAGLRLMLDFIPNHTGLSHPWARHQPEFYIPLANKAEVEAGLGIALKTEAGLRYLAHGRDPHFAPWSDTLQLNYANPELQAAMRAELLKAAGLCDGLRCDMAMLALPEVFERTWERKMPPFWPEALAALRAQVPDCLLLAEVYWDLERTLLAQGFDYTYDKHLYDRLVEKQAGGVRAQLRSEAEVIDRMAHFLENHDERRAAELFPHQAHQAGAALTYLLPGLRFFFAGQIEGYRQRAPVQFCQPPPQQSDPALRTFYEQLLAGMRRSQPAAESWALLEPLPAWESNPTWADFVAFTWQGEQGGRWLAVVNYSGHHSQCYLRLPWPELGGRSVWLRDRLSPAEYLRQGDELLGQGLYLDLPEWGYHLFELELC